MCPLRSRLLILIGGVLFVGISPSLFGHGSEYVYAKLSIGSEPRSVVLELGVEFLANPLVDSKKEAHEILSADVLIESSVGAFSMRDLGEQVDWSERGQFDSDAPLAAAEHDDEPHQMLVARADLSDLDVDSLNLRVSDESLQAVIFWVDEQPAESDTVRRVFLIAGDHSMPVDLPSKPRRQLPMILTAVVLIFLILFFAIRARIK